MNKLKNKKETDMWNVILVTVVTAITPKIASTIVDFIEETIDDVSKAKIFDELAEFFGVNKNTAVTQQALLPPATKPRKKRPTIKLFSTPDSTKFTAAEYDFTRKAKEVFDALNNKLKLGPRGLKGKFDAEVFGIAMNKIFDKNKSMGEYTDICGNGTKVKVNSMLSGIEEEHDHLLEDDAITLINIFCKANEKWEELNARFI